MGTIEGANDLRAKKLKIQRNCCERDKLGRKAS